MNRQKAKKIIIGLILLALGIAWLGNAVDLWDFSVFFPGWWAALVMICFFVSVIGDGPNVINVLGMLIFGAVVLKSNGMIPDFVNLWLVAFALAVILFGGKLMVSAFRGSRRGSLHNENVSDGNSVPEGNSVSYAFASETLRFSGQTIHSCEYGVSSRGDDGVENHARDFHGARVYHDDARPDIDPFVPEIHPLLCTSCKKG